MKRPCKALSVSVRIVLALAYFSAATQAGEPLSGTTALTWQGDLAARLVDQVDGFLLDELQRSVSRRSAFWQRDLTSVEAYERSIQPQRERLAHLLGVRDTRATNTVPRLISPALAARIDADDGPFENRIGYGNGFDIYPIEWSAFGDVQGTGLLLLPRQSPVADVVAIPDCEILPEQLVGLLPGVPPANQYARHLAEAGCRVVVPLLVNRARGQFDWGARPAPAITNREMLYRSAYELGRGMIAYEIQQILAVVDWFDAESERPVGVIGWGEGGLLALYCAALDQRIRSTAVSGYFDSRQRIWEEPIDRNVFGLLEQFGDAELATLVAPRRLVIEATQGPQAELEGSGGAPARLRSPDPSAVAAEVERARELVNGLTSDSTIELVTSSLAPDVTRVDGSGAEGSGAEGPGSAATLQAFIVGLGVDAKLDTSTPSQDKPAPVEWSTATPPTAAQLKSRHYAHLRQLDRHSQQLLHSSPDRRREFMEKLKTSSLEEFQQSVEPYRAYFYNEVIGRFDHQLVDPQPRARLFRETDKWRGYEVVLNVFDSVFAYGLLLVPKDIQPGQQRPVVVCQHGLEGRPQDTIGTDPPTPYAAFASRLADEGFITFAPQNLYIGGDRFRTLQRKSYPLKKTLFSTIVPQHQQIVNWLKTLPMVDPQRIAFYGLSYGGKTAMRVPPLVSDYCLVICSGDFNEWVDKNASISNPRSYVWTGEYEIFEFDLGSTFNYAEMAALIAPRPFMVERGHFDGVADDWTVGWEFAKVRHLYAARLGIPDRCRIEWFVGPHKIHGVGTFEFLHQQLNWP